jgi:hypothetical protein
VEVVRLLYTLVRECQDLQARSWGLKGANHGEIRDHGEVGEMPWHSHTRTREGVSCRSILLVFLGNARRSILLASGGICFVLRVLLGIFVMSMAISIRHGAVQQGSDSTAQSETKQITASILSVIILLN